MKELTAIVRECYGQLPSLPGFYKYKILADFLSSVNQNLSLESMNLMDEKSFREFILNNFQTKIIEEYKHGEDTFPAILIKDFILPQEEITILRKRISTILLSNLPNQQDWYELVKIGPVLKAANIDYKNLGFARLIELLKVVFDDDFKSEVRGEISRPKNYVYLNTSSYAEENTIPFSPDTQGSKTIISENQSIKIIKNSKEMKVTAYTKLMNFAAFPDKDGETGFKYAIRQLAEEKALKENWFYGAPEEDPGTYPILKNYLLLTFERLLAEDEEHSDETTWEKKILTTDTNAVFNTGLVDKLYEPVYALFYRNKNKKSSRKWVFWTFVKSNDKEHQVLTRVFGTNLPSPAHYYNNTSELVYNIKKEIGSYNWDHFIDNCSRLPIDFLRDNGPTRFDYNQSPTPLFYKSLADAIKADPRSMNRIKNRITDAIDYAIKRVRWNFKTAIPIYYPGQKKISLLLPLALVDEETINVALVLEATKSGAYIAHTILTLEMAYTNARLITRPDSDWLTAEKISASNTSVDEDE